MRGSVPCQYANLSSRIIVKVGSSHPVFWEQQGLQTFGHKIQITRPQASQPAFERHFIQLVEEYGAAHAINLLGTKENEASLTAAYARSLHIAQNNMGDAIGITHFDFHNAVRLYGHDGVIGQVRWVLFATCILSSRSEVIISRQEGVVDNVDKFGFTMVDSATNDVITYQKGVFRTNCLDW